MRRRRYRRGGQPPAMPRIIQWQGEPMEFLQKLGFDAVWMGRLPVASELAEASGWDCAWSARRRRPSSSRPLPLDARFPGVGLGPWAPWPSRPPLTCADPWSQAIGTTNRPDATRAAPAAGDAREASRIADLLMLGRPRSARRSPGRRTGRGWTAAALVRGGTPLWVNIDTHCGSHFVSQLGALRGALGDRAGDVP